MDALVFYDIENNASSASVHIGTVGAGTSDDTLLAVHNTSDLYQAEDVTVTVEPSAHSIQLWLSTDGDTFASTIDIGDIPPGGSSPTFWLRRITASDTAAGGFSAQLSATPAAYSSPVDTTTSDNIPISTEDI